MQTMLQWKSIFRVCVCSLRYPLCNAHAPYCHLWPARLYHILPHYLINGTISGVRGGGSLNTKCAFWLSLQLLPEIFPILRKTERDVIINMYLSPLLTNTQYTITAAPFPQSDSHCRPSHVPVTFRTECLCQCTQQWPWSRYNNIWPLSGPHGQITLSDNSHHDFTQTA